MKATNQFITRTTSNGSFIKVVLNQDHNVYPYFYKNVHFFIHRDHWSGLWNAIESRSGSSIITDYHTKKECLKDALLRIDDIPDMERVIQHHIIMTNSAKIISMDKYLEIES